LYCVTKRAHKHPVTRWLYGRLSFRCFLNEFTEGEFHDGEVA